MAIRTKGKKLIQNGIDELKAFRTSSGSVRGYEWKPTDGESNMPPMGRLPKDWKIKLAHEAVKQNVRYVIYSYGTPIAWALYLGGWVVPDVNYSVTTTQHQGIVRTAIANYGFYNQF